MWFEVTACLNTTWQHYANSGTWINFWKHVNDATRVLQQDRQYTSKYNITLTCVCVTTVAVEKE